MYSWSQCTVVHTKQCMQVEKCTSIAMIPRYWNINTGLFLRRYVYERWGGGTVALAATQMISGLWHGLREGHLFYFLFTIPMLQSSKGTRQAMVCIITEPGAMLHCLLQVVSSRVQNVCVLDTQQVYVLHRSCASVVDLVVCTNQVTVYYQLHCTLEASLKKVTRAWNALRCYGRRFSTWCVRVQ